MNSKVIRNVNTSHFFDGHVFSNSKRNLIINKQGYILLMEDSLFKRLMHQQSSDVFFKKLERRGFLSRESQIEEIELLPEFFMIDLTNKCNLRCKYCFRDVDRSNKSISRKIIDDICSYITRYCDEYNVKDISVQAWGGEPLLEKDLVYRIKEHIHPKKTHLHFSIETNGTLLSKEMVEELYNHHVGIGVSIDGREKDHDSQRVYINGVGSFLGTSSGLKRSIKKYGSSIGTITTITRNNYRNIDQILDYYAKELKIRNLKFNFVHKSDFVDNDSLCLSIDEIKETEERIFEKLIQLVLDGYRIFDSNIKIKIKNILQREYSDICLSRGCCGGRKMIVFDMEGGIYPCELTDYKEQKLGSIYEDLDLPLLLKESIKKSHFYEKKHQEKCDDCPWYFFCRGGCTIRMMNEGKKAPEIDEIECAINTCLYPKIVSLILSNMDLAYQILEI